MSGGCAQWPIPNTNATPTQHQRNSNATLLYISPRAWEVYRRPPRVQVGWFLVRLQPIAIDSFNFEISKFRYFRNSSCQVEESFCRDGAIVPVYGLVLITLALYKRFLLLPDKGCFENFEISKVRKSHSTPFDTKDQFRTGSRRVRSTPVFLRAWEGVQTTTTWSRGVVSCTALTTARIQPLSAQV